MASSRSIIVNAFVMSLFGVLCVIGFDKQADSVQKRGGTVYRCRGQCRAWHQGPPNGGLHESPGDCGAGHFVGDELCLHETCHEAEGS